MRAGFRARRSRAPPPSGKNSVGSTDARDARNLGVRPRTNGRPQGALQPLATLVGATCQVMLATVSWIRSHRGL
jgi:hypothetical protein